MSSDLDGHLLQYRRAAARAALTEAVPIVDEREARSAGLDHDTGQFPRFVHGENEDQIGAEGSRGIELSAIEPVSTLGRAGQSRGGHLGVGDAPFGRGISDTTSAATRGSQRASCAREPVRRRDSSRLK